MAENESYTNAQLQVELIQHKDSITVRFLGKSILRDPSEFVMPILVRSLDQATSDDRRLVMDFQDLAYMNSSTLTPVIKILERARVGSGSVTAVYRRSLKWQEMSFAALRIFETRDGRIEIQGVD